MPTLVPIIYTESPFDGDPDVTFEYVYSAMAGLVVQASPDVGAVSHLGIDVQGQPIRSGLEAQEVKGIPVGLGLGSIDNGIVPDNPGYGAFGVGAWSPPDGSLGSMELTGEGLAFAYAALNLGMYPSLGGYVAYIAYAALELRSGSYDPAPASLDTRSNPAAPSRATASVRGLADAPARGTMETAIQAGYPALSSLEAGNLLEATAIASIDAQDGEGLAFIVDIQDEILATGGGE